MGQEAETLQDLADRKYKYGFVTDIESDFAPKGLKRRHRPLRLRQEERAGLDAGMASRGLSAVAEDDRTQMGAVHYKPIDFQDAYYYAAPKNGGDKPKSLDEVDPKLIKTYEKLGIPLSEQLMLAGVAVDAVFDSVSVATTFKAKLEEAGVIFCPISEAITKHPDSGSQISRLGRSGHG